MEITNGDREPRRRIAEGGCRCRCYQPGRVRERVQAAYAANSRDELELLLLTRDGLPLLVPKTPPGRAPALVLSAPPSGRSHCGGTRRDPCRSSLSVASPHQGLVRRPFFAVGAHPAVGRLKVVAGQGRSRWPLRRTRCSQPLWELRHRRVCGRQQLLPRRSVYKYRLIVRRFHTCRFYAWLTTRVMRTPKRQCCPGVTTVPT